MKKGRFLLGFAFGAAAGAAAKLLYENREEVYILVTDTAKIAKDEINDFVGYASERFSDVGEDVAKKASKYIDIAKEQIHDLKENIIADLEDEIEAVEETGEPAGEEATENNAE
ncbi:MAG: hypothetical protein FWG10_10415 [Eubacteriaceae bacterium]|nr:hypothetical protein [Eubacteriaceae bacterium]